MYSKENCIISLLRMNVPTQVSFIIISLKIYSKLHINSHSDFFHWTKEWCFFSFWEILSHDVDIPILPVIWSFSFVLFWTILDHILFKEFWTTFLFIFLKLLIPILCKYYTYHPYIYSHPYILYELSIFFLANCMNYLFHPCI